MKKQPHKQISRLGLCTLILLYSSTVLSQSTLSLSERKEQLKSTARQDPLATQAIKELHGLQKQQKAKKMEALEALVVGLTSFRQSQFIKAGKELKKAMRNPYLQNIVEFVLPDTDLLDRIIKECQRYDSVSKCKPCTGFGFECCPGCGGIGRDICTTKFCGGTGKVNGLMWLKSQRGKQPSNFNQPDDCFNCRSSGWQVCEACDGKGIDLCKSCHRPADNILLAEDYGKIEKLLGVIGYLKGGGIDFFLGDFKTPLVFNEPDQKE